jgi:hypothetical protein
MQCVVEADLKRKRERSVARAARKAQNLAAAASAPGEGLVVLLPCRSGLAAELRALSSRASARVPNVAVLLAALAGLRV